MPPDSCRDIGHDFASGCARTPRTSDADFSPARNLLFLPGSGLRGRAQSWPNRPIRLIVPTGPGAATDIMARLLADGITRKVGQPVIVENMPGASGIVAHQAAARAEPDGHTLLFTNTSGMAINLVSFKQLPYDPTRDFTPVAMVCSLGPQMLSVNADLPIRTVPSCSHTPRRIAASFRSHSIRPPAQPHSARSCSIAAAISAWSKCPTDRQRR